MVTVGGASLQEDEWFGEGSAFDSGEDLAAALFALAGTSEAPPFPKPEIIWPGIPAYDADPVFVEVERQGGLDEARRPGSQYGGDQTHRQLGYVVGPVPRRAVAASEDLGTERMDDSQQRCRAASHRGRDRETS